MKITTNNREFAKRYEQPLEVEGWKLEVPTTRATGSFVAQDDSSDSHSERSEESILAKEIFSSESKLYISNSREYENYCWSSILMVDVAEESQYDILIKLAQAGKLNEEAVCIAGSGKKFHGFRQRKWESMQGNIHLSCNFKPQCEIKNYGIGFLMIAANSVVQAIDDIPELKGKAGIKWVNDILIDGKKVCGVLSHSLYQGQKVNDAILGIGLNVEKTPEVEPTIFVPDSACLNDFLDDNQKVNESLVFRYLLKHLDENYKKLISGKYDELLDFYRERSIILNRNVAIWSDERDGTNEKEYEGIARGIGESMELYIKDVDKPIINGRLSIKD